jgi:hypothetical protein
MLYHARFLTCVTLYRVLLCAPIFVYNLWERYFSPQEGVMGSPRTEAHRDRDESQHQVTVSSFYMSAKEVTLKEYLEVMQFNPNGLFQGANLPAININWYSAVEYCNARSIAEGLTRTEDVYLSLEERVSKPNQANGNISRVIFVSIHLNYSPNENASGIEAYYYLPVLLDPDAYITVQYLKGTIQNNAPLAQSIINAIGNIPELENLSRSIKNADYYVLRNTTVPAVLVECGFLSNKHEALSLNNAPYREKLVEGIAAGIENFLNTDDYSFF